MSTPLSDEPRLPLTPAMRVDDEQLHLMTSLAESGARLGLTVVVPGGVLSGQLVGTDEYVRRLGDLVRQGLKTDEPRPEEPEEPSHELSTEHRVPFLHLVDARFISGPTLMPQAGAGFLMRVRVADVAAWSIGSLSQGAG